MISAFQKLTDFKPENLARTVDKFQSNVDATFQSLLKNPTLDGTLTKNISLISGQDNYVSHGLGRNFVGYELTRFEPTLEGTAHVESMSDDVWISDTSNKSPEKFVILRCNENSTIDLWVF